MAGTANKAALTVDGKQALDGKQRSERLHCLPSLAGRSKPPRQQPARRLSLLSHQRNFHQIPKGRGVRGSQDGLRKAGFGIYDLYL